MKTTIIGLMVGLVTALLVYTSATASNEVFAMVLGIVLLIPTLYLLRMNRQEQSRTERFVNNGINHYRTHVHHKRVIKKTS